MRGILANHQGPTMLNMLRRFADRLGMNPVEVALRGAIVAFFLLVLAVAPAPYASAQFTPPPAPGANATVGFFSIGKTSWLAATGTSSNVALSNVASQGFTQVQVYNAGATIAFVACSPSSTVAASVGTAGSAATDYPVAPGAIIVMSVSGGTGFCAAVMASSTAAIYFTPGVGL